MRIVLIIIFMHVASPGFAGSFFVGSFELPINKTKVSKSELGGQVVYVGDMKFYVPDLLVLSVTPNRWDNGLIVIEFDENVTQDNQNIFLGACLNWQDAGVRCVERSNETNFYRVVEHNGEGCGNIPKVKVSCAPLGFQISGASIEIHESHWDSDYVLTHEIGHAFGLIHEHNRADRDNFVTINLSNVKAGVAYAFHIRNTVINTDYDYQSIMHYRNCTLSIHDNCTSAEKDISLQTIYVSGCGLPNEVGGLEISTLDIDTLRAAYNPALAAAFGSTRQKDCGQKEYSERQISSLCADGSCKPGTFTPVKWIKTIEISGSDCGFAPIRNYPLMCTKKNKEHINTWFDTDPCSCGLCVTLFEWWVSCGCSVQVAQNKCTNFNTPLTLQKARELMESGDPKYAAVGSLYRKFLVLYDDGHVEQQVLHSIGKAVAANLSDPDFGRKFRELSSGLRILAAARVHEKKSTTRSWKLSDTSFRQFIKRVGLDDSF